MARPFSSSSSSSSSAGSTPTPIGDVTIGAGLPRFSSTRLATDIGAVTREVMREGAAVITRHDAPMMVLVSIDRYAELERASTPDLDALSGRFDALYARMQSPGVAQHTLAALDLDARGQARPAQRLRTPKANRRK